MSEERPLECSVCGLAWRSDALAINCCLPGVIEYEQGATDKDKPKILEFRCGGSAMIYDLPLLVQKLNEARDGRTWTEFNASIGTYPSFFGNIVNQGNKHMWVQEVLYAKLMEVLGDPVPGTMYWPPELSRPVGGIPRGAMYDEASQ